uniref:EH domain-containing protein n=1 Tax=Monodelphis domestica TaxID=13616 RepID=A0A5F8H8H5_MONDO
KASPLMPCSSGVQDHPQRRPRALSIGGKVDSNNVGRVLAPDAAAFLKKSGLPDLILGKVEPPLASGYPLDLLSPQEFFVALRLVACAQNGLEVSLSSLHLAVPPPRFVRKVTFKSAFMG